MENIYNFPKNDLINVREATEKYLKELENYPFPKKDRTDDEEIKTLMKFSDTDDEFQKLKESVSLDTELIIEDSLPILEFDPDDKDRYVSTACFLAKGALDLETIKELLKFRENIKGRFGNKRSFPFGKTEFSYRIIKNSFVPAIVNHEKMLQPYSDILITIRVYRPFRYLLSRTTYGPTLQEEFIVLGSQYLTELRDKISCNFNNCKIIEISSNPNQDNPLVDTMPGFFFITDTFYNDTRNPNNPDYSINIRKWLKNREEFEPNKFKTAKMEQTKFTDLNLRLGYPQVYQHSGNCEHLFCFSSIRFLNNHDPMNRINYPILRSISLQKISLCNLCGLRQYSYIVQDSNKQLYDPSYLCYQCFQRYHYIDGKKNGDFKAYRINETKIHDNPDPENLCDDDDDDPETTYFTIHEFEDIKSSQLQ